MSKAFTRETDEITGTSLTKQRISPLPAGAKNYTTVQGNARLHRELNQLLLEPFTESARQRILEIKQCLKSAVVVAPPPPPWHQVLFGAVVTVRNHQGDETVYHIVGKDEVDTDRNFISWYSPLAKALLKTHVGEHVQFRSPSGEENLEIIGVHYE